MTFLLPTELIGSYALPGWFCAVLERAEQTGEFGEADLREALDDAVNVALFDQQRAGLSVLTDGEMRRRDFIQNFYGLLTGVRKLPPLRRFGAAGYDQNPRYEVIDKIAAPMGLNLVPEWQYLRRQVSGSLKICVPGPLTLALPLIIRGGYRDREALLPEMISIVNAEMKALAAAGAEYLQLDEPRYATSREDARRLVEIFNATRDGVPARVGLHLCFGNYHARSHDRRDYSYVLSALANAHCDQFNFEFANREFAQIELLEQLETRANIGIGTIDVKSYFVETPAEVAAAIRRAIKHVAVERIVVTPDCGFNHTPRHVAFRKICSMVEGAISCAGNSQGVKSLFANRHTVPHDEPASDGFRIGSEINPPMTATELQTDRSQWIDGKSVASRSEEAIVIRDPASGEPFAAVARGCAEDAAAAVEAAQRQRPSWANRAPTERAALLRGALSEVARHRDEIAELLTRENGKPLSSARAEVDVAVLMARNLIELGVNLSGRSVGAGAGELIFQVCQPRGVAVCLNTWNAPVVAAVEMVVANLVVGNTVVLKTSERAPLATRMILERAFAALPPGALQVLSGDGPNVGAPLVDHPGADLVCFIGSVGIGRQIGRTTGQRVRKAILELGGKDAMIVDEGIDPRQAAKLACPSCFANSGQICTSVERLYVLKSVHDEFVAELARLAASLKIGPGMEPQTQIGPLIAQDIRQHVEQQVDQAVAAGTQVVTGGKRLEGRGYFYPPSVLTGVRDDMLLMQEETFGPIAPVLAVESFDEAIERANRTWSGLSAIVCTENVGHAEAAIRHLECGMVKINSPRGQIPYAPAEPAKDSGFGSGHGLEFLHELTYRKSVHWQTRLGS